MEKVSLTACLAAWLAAFARCAQGEGKRDTSVIMIKMHYPILGEDMKDAGRVFWLVRHPLSNIISQAKWHITGSHTKVVTEAEFNKYLTAGTFRYHLKMWCVGLQALPHSHCCLTERLSLSYFIPLICFAIACGGSRLFSRRVQHANEWIGRTNEKDTLVVRMEDFKVDCNNVRHAAVQLPSVHLQAWAASLASLAGSSSRSRCSPAASTSWAGLLLLSCGSNSSQRNSNCLSIGLTR